MCSYLIRRGATYYFRRAIPGDVQPALDRREWVYSLQTKDREAGKRRAQAEGVRTNKLIDDARANLTATASVDRISTPALVIPLPVYEPAAPTSRQDVGTSLSAIIDKWAAERQVTAKTVDAATAAVRWFHDRMGPISVEKLSRKDILAFKDALLSAGTSIPNTKMKIARLSGLLSYAVDNDLIPVNPAKGLVIADPQAARNKRIGFDRQALAALFSGPVHAQHERPTGGKGEAAYWLPLLALYTGARLEELGQLRPRDVELEHYLDATDHDQTAWVIRITEDKADGLHLKNAGSERTVPIHPALERLGFIEFVQAAKASGQARIFHELKPDKYGRYTAKWGEWFSSYRRDVCLLTDRRLVFHSFRHSFKDFARHCGMVEGIQRQIMGHSGDDTADDYGSGYSLFQVVEAVRRYRVPAFDLPTPAIRTKM